MLGNPCDKDKRFQTTVADEWCCSEESECSQQEELTLAVDAEEIDGRNKSYSFVASFSDHSSRSFWEIAILCCMTTGLLLVLTCFLSLHLALHLADDVNHVAPSPTTFPYLCSLAENVYTDITNPLSSLFCTSNSLLYRCFSSNSTSFFDNSTLDNSTLAKSFEFILHNMLLGVSTLVICGVVDCCASMYEFVVRCSNSFFIASSSASRGNASLTRVPLAILLLSMPVSGTSAASPNITINNELGLPVCNPADAVKYGKCFPGEFVPESDTCPVTIPQSVNYYFLPHLNRIIPVLLKMRTTEEGGGQIPRASWGRPGKNILPSSMDNNSVLVLCLVVGAMGPVSPIFLIASVSIAGPAFTPPHRFPFNLISAFLGSWFFKLVTQCALQCLVMVRDDAAVYLYVAIGVMNLVCWLLRQIMTSIVFSFRVFLVFLCRFFSWFLPQVLLPSLIFVGTQAIISLHVMVLFLYRPAHWFYTVSMLVVESVTTRPLIAVTSWLVGKIVDYYLYPLDPPPAHPAVQPQVPSRLTVEEEHSDPSSPHDTSYIPYKETQKLPDNSWYVHSSYVYSTVQVKEANEDLPDENEKLSSARPNQATFRREDGSYVLTNHVSSTIVGEDDVVPPVSKQSSGLQGDAASLNRGQESSSNSRLLLPTFPLKIAAALFHDVNTSHATNHNTHLNKVATNLHHNNPPGDIRQPRDDPVHQNPDESNPNLRPKGPRVTLDEQASLLTKSTRAASEENPANEGETPVACSRVVIPQFSDSLARASDTIGQPRPTEYDPCGDKPVTLSITQRSFHTGTREEHNMSPPYLGVAGVVEERLPAESA